MSIASGSGSSSSREVLSPSELSDEKQRLSNEANKEVRDRYRSLLFDQQEKVDRAGEPGLPIGELQSMVLQANVEVVKVQRPREAALDAEYLRTCGQLMKAGLERKQYGTKEFRPTEFSQNLIKFIQGDEERDVNLQDNRYWKILGKATLAIFQSSCAVENTYAGIDFEKPKKERQQRKRDEAVGAKVVPTLVKEIKDSEERQGEELNRIFRILKKKYWENGKKPVCFFRFVINPRSYCHTVENIFHTSFLINLLRAQIIEDKDGFPLIMPREADAANKMGSKHQEAESSQCVVSLSTDEFKEVIRLFNIKESTIPSPQGPKRSGTE